MNEYYVMLHALKSEYNFENFNFHANSELKKAGGGYGCTQILSFYHFTKGDEFRDFLFAHDAFEKKSLLLKGKNFASPGGNISFQGRPNS